MANSNEIKTRIKIIAILILTIFSMLLWNSGLIKFNEYRKTLSSHRRYLPLEEDLKKRPLPRWYQDAKIGIMVNIGIYSVPGYEVDTLLTDMVNDGMYDESLLVQRFLRRNYPPKVTYQDFAPKFKAEFFDPKGWAQLFKKAGAKYVIFTSKHNDGFAMFNSKQSPRWNSVEIGPHRDLVGDLASAVKSVGMEFGVFYDLLEPHNPEFIEDFLNGSTFHYRDEKVLPDLKQLVNDYKPSILWGSTTKYTVDGYDLNSNLFLAWLYNDSPVKDTVVVNNRWHITAPKEDYGDFYASESLSFFDRLSDQRIDFHEIDGRKVEQMCSIHKTSFGYQKQAHLSDIISAEELIITIVSVVVKGGNILINVGATSEGTIPLIFQDRLIKMGNWLQRNGEAIYGTSLWIYAQDEYNANAWYTCKKLAKDPLKKSLFPANRNDPITDVFVIFFRPQNDTLTLRNLAPFMSNFYSYRILGMENCNIDYTVNEKIVEITLPKGAYRNCQEGCALQFTTFLKLPNLF